MAVGATAAAGDEDSIFNGKLIFVAVFGIRNRLGWWESLLRQTAFRKAEVLSNLSCLQPKLVLRHPISHRRRLNSSTWNWGRDAQQNWLQ